MKFRLLLAAAVVALVPSVASADTLGDQRTFNVNRFYDLSGATSVPATLRAVGDRAYFYVDDRAWANLGPERQGQFSLALGELVREFDSKIYPRATALWGNEPSPGVDGDPRITVLLERLIAGNGGYFDSLHAYPADQAPGSNQREMIMVSADSVLAATARGFLAHEFEHLISVGKREMVGRDPEDIWLNEARAEYTITAVGQSEPFSGSTLQRRVGGFVRTPSDSLTEWPNTSNDYAIASLFVHYLVDRFGTDILVNTLGASRGGVPALNAWLVVNAGRTFDEVFADWMLAAAANDRTLGAQYGYLLPSLTGWRVAPTYTASLSAGVPSTWNLELKEYQPVWFKLELPPGTLPPSLELRALGAPVTGIWMADYGSGRGVGRIATPVPTVYQGSTLRSVLLAVAPVWPEAVGSRIIAPKQIAVSATLGNASAPPAVQAAATPVPEAVYVNPVNGDLIRRPGQRDVYVVWDGYRRYLPQGVLELYGFQNRSVREVPDDVFFRLKVSNYIRTQSGKQVFAVRPEGTKHWLNITPTQWDASRRDWGAIFTVNDREAEFYRTGDDIRQ